VSLKLVHDVDGDINVAKMNDIQADDFRCLRNDGLADLVEIESVLAVLGDFPQVCFRTPLDLNGALILYDPDLTGLGPDP
jgi:hypothetical protein